MTTTSATLDASSTPATPPAQRHDRIVGADTTLLKCLSTVLIVNSHCEALWPRSWMAADGMLGGELFYLIAGFGLVLGSRVRCRPFFPWYWRRLVRIYPALLITMLLVEVFAMGGWRSWHPTDYLESLLWPTHYNFVRDIVGFYIIFYFLLKLNDARVYLAAMVILLVPYGMVYAQDISQFTATTKLHLGSRPLIISVVACGQMMLLGGWLGSRAGHGIRTRGIDLFVLTALFGIYVAAKYEMVVAGHFAFAYPVLHLLVLAISYYLYRITQSDALLAFMRRPGPLPWLIALLAGLTLEIYVVHEYVMHNSHLQYAATGAWRVPFPANLLVLGVLAITWAYLLSKAVSWTRHAFARPAVAKAAERIP